MFQKALLLFITLIFSGQAMAQDEGKLSIEALHDSANIDTKTLLQQILKSSDEHLALRQRNLQQEIELLDVRNDLLEQQKGNQRRTVWALGLFFVASLFVFYFLYRNKKKTNQKLIELDQIKARLFADISHEFRTPLTLIKGPLQMLLDEPNLSSSALNKLNLVKRNSDQLSRLVESINDLTKLEAGHLKLAVHRVDMHKHLRNIAAPFVSLADLRNINFIAKIELSDRSYYYDASHIETIVSNLLSNAFKFCPRGSITLSAKTLQDRVEITVSDSGIGIAAKDLSQIFDRYFRASSDQYHSEGIGIGLAQAYQLAKLHKGDLQVQSKLGEGSQFSLTFPIIQNAYNADERAIEIIDSNTQVDPSQQDSKIENRETISIRENDQVLLLVEDNEDMRKYLTDIFDEDYQVVHAENGIDGFGQATSYIPDLIISDLMMPQMNGQELLIRIREEEKTSHIPFILLTANVEEEAKLEGLREGADDYITKPFSVNEIKLKVQNLIAIRQQLREKYQSSGGVPPRRMIENEVDKAFWERLELVVAENLSKAEFSADDFAKAMFMSRMQLHRKLKALTNESASRFLRKQRLKAATELLHNPNWSISNVAYEVGFTSPSYFTKCFKEEYGMSPKEYVPL